MNQTIELSKTVTPKRRNREKPPIPPDLVIYEPLARDLAAVAIGYQAGLSYTTMKKKLPEYIHLKWYQLGEQIQKAMANQVPFPGCEFAYDDISTDILYEVIDHVQQIIDSRPKPTLVS